MKLLLFGQFSVYGDTAVAAKVDAWLDVVGAFRSIRSHYNITDKHVSGMYSIPVFSITTLLR